MSSLEGPAHAPAAPPILNPAGGANQIRVRAYDGTGRPQDESITDSFPSGATGLHTITVHAQ